MKKMFLAGVIALSLTQSVFATDCGQDGMCLDTFQKVTIGGSANFGGFGADMFTGDEGGVKVEKVGYSATDLVMNVGGDLCGADCQSGSFNFSAKAGEMLSVMAGAVGTKPGETVSAVNEGGVFSNATFQFGNFNLPTTTTTGQ